ncbi:cytochrome P450 [Hyaloraphidium curvatum]|nr:cytochrome P450 [Hyaloraphidium curvatum]
MAGLVDAVFSNPLVLLFLSACVGLGLLLAILAIQFPDRAIFTKKRNDVVLAKGGKPIVGHLYDAKSLANINRRLEYELERIKEYGLVRRVTVWPIFKPSLDVIISNNPADITHIHSDPYLWVKDAESDNTFEPLLGEGIFNSDGHAWSASRKIASKLFTLKGFRDYFSGDFINECDHLSEHLRAAADAGAVVDLQDLLLRCTLDSFTRLALGKDPKSLYGKPIIKDGRYSLPPSEFMNAFDQLILLCSMRGADPLWRWTEHLNGRRKQVEHCVKIVDGFAYQVMKEKRAALEKRGEKKEGSSPDDDRMDLLDFFLSARNDDGSPLTDRQLRDAVLNFLIAGRDTTAQTLSWCFWEIAQRPDVEAKLREEAMRVLGKDGKTTYETLKDLPYAYSVFNETLRLHANVPAQGKTATADTVLPGSGIKIDKGMIVGWNNWAMGRLTEVWGPDAEEFKPERWMLEEGGVMKQNSRVKHYVFNGGPRLCLGINFAQQEATVFLSTLIRRFKLTLVNEDDPTKWGNWNEDPAKRDGRYTLGVTLGLRGTVDFAVQTL